MAPKDPPRPGEIQIDLPEKTDAEVYFIGRIRTPFEKRADCPKNSRESNAIGIIELDRRYSQGLTGIERYSHVIILYWMHQARRDLIAQVPRHLGEPRGTFALRSPVRPNPIALSVVELMKVENNTLMVRNVDCLDGTPLIDIKPYFASTDSVPDARR
jgi:tRNA-Thr(GGU) m(6)t(6)A37 methyltransferase TsaA